MYIGYSWYDYPSLPSTLYPLPDRLCHQAALQAAQAVQARLTHLLFRHYRSFQGRQVREEDQPRYEYPFTLSSGIPGNPHIQMRPLDWAPLIYGNAG